MQHHTRNALDWMNRVPEGSTPLVLVRHGQTAWNKERRFLGRTDIPLDEDGRMQAAAVAGALVSIPLVAVYTSHLSRASQTAEAVAAAHGLTPTINPDLQELDQGELEGSFGADLAAHYPDFHQAWEQDPANTRAPGGETLSECNERVLRATREIMAAHPGPQPIAIISHRIVVSCIVCEALGLPLRMWRRVGQRNTAVNLLSARDGRLQLHRLNDTGHLA
jgi:probable phosphoglycerate mutase